MATLTRRPRLEVADIVRRHGDELRRRYRLSRVQLAALRHIGECRTAALGGHRDTCDTCGHVRLSYNSCRDRHCPKCQSLKKAEWLEQRRARLLPVNYFHVVFTVPEKLNGLILGNRRFLYGLIFKAAADSLQLIAADPKHLGARVGFTAILHTWGQNLQFHPHLHCVVTGGGLALDGSRWLDARPRYFLPVKVLAELFRGKFLDALKLAYHSGELTLAMGTEKYRKPRVFRRLLAKLYKRRWIVDARPPFGGPEHVYRYLGRYTHRVAISNHRLISLQDAKVRFRYRDYRDGQKPKTMTLDAVEFLRRFALHILPRRFVRIRHYGLLAGSNVDTKLARARELLADRQGAEAIEPPKPVVDPEASWSERLLALTGVDVLACPLCGVGRMIRVPLDGHEVPALAVAVPRPFATLDSS